MSMSGMFRITRKTLPIQKLTISPQKISGWLLSTCGAWLDPLDHQCTEHQRHDGGARNAEREAPNRLAAEGWAQHLDQREFVAASVSDAALREPIDTRIAIETLALRQCMERRTADWQERLVLALHRPSIIPRSLSPEHYEEKPAWEALHRALHVTLIEQCGSRWLIGFCEQLYDQAYRYRQLAVKTAYRKRDEQDEHGAIVDATVRADTDAACEALRAHDHRTASIILGEP